MTWQSNPAVIRLRNVARGLGLTKIIAPLVRGNTYEEAFDTAIFAAIQSGDTVWDVGANAGYYTLKFAEAVGPEGKVLGFEPFPQTYEHLNAQLERGKDASQGAITTYPVALGATQGVLKMQGGADELAATSRLLEDDTATAGADDNISEVTIQTGDAMLAELGAPVPNVIKIDTEGFELDVLQGMSSVLSNPTVRGVYIEVHFGLLADRGLADAPSTIEGLLKSAGFKTTWVDSSHIAGLRGGAA